MQVASTLHFTLYVFWLKQNDIQLSKNFMLSEFTASETARRFKINNDASESSENIQDSDNLTNTHTIPRCFGCKN